MISIGVFLLNIDAFKFLLIGSYLLIIYIDHAYSSIIMDEWLIIRWYQSVVTHVLLRWIWSIFLLNNIPRKCFAIRHTEPIFGLRKVHVIFWLNWQDLLL